MEQGTSLMTFMGRQLGITGRRINLIEEYREYLALFFEKSGYSRGVESINKLNRFVLEDVPVNISYEEVEKDVRDYYGGRGFEYTGCYESNPLIRLLAFKKNRKGLGVVIERDPHDGGSEDIYMTVF